MATYEMERGKVSEQKTELPFDAHKEIARSGQALLDERAKAERTKPKAVVFTVGYRAYNFMDGCRCGHVHLIADGGATLEACGGDCAAHPYEFGSAEQPLRPVKDIPALARQYAETTLAIDKNAVAHDFEMGYRAAFTDLPEDSQQANGDTLRVHVHDRGSGFEKTYTLRAPDEWLEHDARHIVEGDVGTTESLMDFAKRVLAMIGAP